MFINTRNKEYYRLRREEIYKKKNLILACIKKAKGIENLSLKLAISVKELKELLYYSERTKEYQLERFRKYYNHKSRKPFENILPPDNHMNKKPILRRKIITADLPNDRSV